MPRWLQILLTLVLFTAAMLVVRAVLHVVVPGFDRWMVGLFGKDAWTALVVGLGIAGGIYGFWPRDRMGRMRPLLARRL